MWDRSFGILLISVLHAEKHFRGSFHSTRRILGRSDYDDLPFGSRSVAHTFQLLPPVLLHGKKGKKNFFQQHINFCDKKKHSKSKAYSLTAKLDYSAIAVLIITSYYPVLFHFFACAPFWGVFYMGCITALGGLAIAVSWIPFFQHPHYVVMRGMLFIGVGLFALVPIPHVLAYVPYSVMREMYVIFGTMGFLYISGATMYMLRIPEKWHAGKFDIIFHSHFLFHCNVVLAAYVHYVGCTRLPNWMLTQVLPHCRAL